MIRSTTSSISTAITSLPPSTEPSARKRSRSGPRSLVPRLPHRAGDISPFAIIGRQVDGARPRAGGRLAGGGGAGGRHGPADPARLGAPLRRREPRRPARPAAARAEVAALARAGGRAGGRRRAGAGPGAGRRGALAPS